MAPMREASSINVTRAERDELLLVGYRIALAVSAAVAWFGFLGGLADPDWLVVASLLMALILTGALATFSRWTDAAQPLAVAAGGLATLEWLVILPGAQDEGVLVSAFMAAVCATGAALLAGITILGGRGSKPAAAPPTGVDDAWIEEDGRRIDG
jgi:hypothetical protein